MADDQLAQKRNVGTEPMEAEPNHDREKTYDAPGAPKTIVAEKQKLPEKTAEAKVENEMGDAVDEVKRRV